MMRCALAVLLTALLLPPFESAHGQWNVPSELLERVSTLSDEQVEFITSGAALKFIPEQQLEHELATRDATGLQNLINDLISLSAEMGYDPGRDMGATPLNIASTRFNAYTLPTPPAGDGSWSFDATTWRVSNGTLSLEEDERGYWKRVA